MGAEHDLPLPQGYSDEETYVRDLLHFVTTSDLLQTLVGGVHILDFFVNVPDLYERILPADWRAWFELHDIDDLMEFFLRDDLDCFPQGNDGDLPYEEEEPPKKLLEYIRSIRGLSLNRTYRESGPYEPMSRQLGLGMNLKKIHEVDHFARYVQRLTSNIATMKGHKISHLVDFGAGQGYLGRVLASRPNNQRVIAVEGRPHNVTNAKSLDEKARLVPKIEIRRNKKEHRAEQELLRDGGQGVAESQNGLPSDTVKASKACNVINPQQVLTTIAYEETPDAAVQSRLEDAVDGLGSVQHVERRLVNGDLSDVIHGLLHRPTNMKTSTSLVQETHDKMSNDRHELFPSDPNLLVISLHSCGNLSHHALRSLVLNPSVTAVAVVGCCYNLTTERLSSPTYKLPSLRPPPQKTAKVPAAEGDPEGFPMSKRLCEYPTAGGFGVRINITARMMAVQAPNNWGPDGSRAFFTRHFYRALLQRIFLDRGVIDPPKPRENLYGKPVVLNGQRPNSRGKYTQPLIIGSLGRKPYRDFVSYVRAAVAKLELYGEQSADFYASMKAISDEEIKQYEQDFRSKKKELSIVWTLMAFNATLIEALIVVDRWLWLKEQDEVERCYVEPVFEYGRSPRNLVVVGIKK